MAAGSQGWRPNCADFPAAAKISPKSINGRRLEFPVHGKLKISVRFHEFVSRIDRAIKVISPMSPIRLYITASRADLLASFRVIHQLMRRNDRNPTPSHPKKIRNSLFEQVNISIFSKKIVSRRKNAVALGSVSI